MTFDSATVGYSGSPVFVQDLESKKWRLQGVKIATGDSNKGWFTVITDIKYVIRKIEDQIIH